MIKGLTAEILKHEGRSCSNGGLSSTADEVTIVGITTIEGSGRIGHVRPVPETARVFEPTEEAPPVVIVHRYLFGEFIPQAVPAAVVDGEIRLLVRDDCVGPMAGGCYITTSDGRYAALLERKTSMPIALHDRFETGEHYATYD